MPHLKTRFLYGNGAAFKSARHAVSGMEEHAPNHDAIQPRFVFEPKRGQSMVTTQSTLVRRRTSFSISMAIAAVATVFAGFAPSYFLRPVLHTAHFPNGRPIPESLPFLLHVHALVFSSWLLLLIVQTTLISNGRVRIHKRLGIIGAILAASIVVMGVAVAIRGARDGWAPGGPFSSPIEFMAVSLGDIAVFASLIGAGLVLRRHAETHKRLMILGTVGGLMWPAITRMPFIAPNPALMYALLAALAFAWTLRDWLVDHRVHPASLWGGVLIAASFPARIAIAHSSLWHHFGAWIIR
jgi:hypothetical protein